MSSHNIPPQQSNPAGDQSAGITNDTINHSRTIDRTTDDASITQANTNNQSSLVRALNDQFRQSFVGGMITVTNGTNALSDAEKLQVMNKVRSFDAFTPDNDPYGEHDFGSFKHKADTYYWKIDCYDLQMLAHSPDPTNPKVTKRVLTIMKAEEY